MKNLLLSVAIGDISGVPYEFEGRTKDYNAVDLLLIVSCNVRNINNISSIPLGYFTRNLFLCQKKSRFVFVKSRTKRNLANEF